MTVIIAIFIGLFVGAVLGRGLAQEAAESLQLILRRYPGDAYQLIESTFQPKAENLTKSVVRILYDRSRRYAYSSTAISIVGTILYYLLGQYFKYQIDYYILMFLSVLIFVPPIRLWIFALRVRFDYYARNEYEARELTSFMLTHSRPDDFDNEDGAKLIDPREFADVFVPALVGRSPNVEPTIEPV